MNKLLTASVRSWKTTALGVLMAVDAVGHAVMSLIDGDPLTNPDWNVTIMLVAAAIALIFARDADVSSKEAGLKS
jgi:hypothetical protein